MEHEQFVELLGYYRISAVYLEQCHLALKSSAMFILLPPTKLVIRNSRVEFKKFCQTLNCERLYGYSARLLTGNSHSKLLSKCRVARFHNCLVKLSIFDSFKVLERLYVVGTLMHSQPTHADFLKVLITQGAHLPLKHISLTGAASEDSLFKILSGRVFP